MDGGEGSRSEASLVSPSLPLDPVLPRNQDGQAIGAKGRKTRRRLLDAASLLLHNGGLGDLKVADVARLAGISPPTFYLYFQDVDDLVLTVVNEHTQSTPALLAMIETPWEGESRAEARAFVEAYMRVWDSHAAIFRVRNLAAEAGRPGFYAAREAAVHPLLERLAGRIARAQANGGPPADLDPQALAGVVVALLERLSAVAQPSGQGSSLREAGLQEAAAYVLATMI